MALTLDYERLKNLEEEFPIRFYADPHLMKQILGVVILGKDHLHYKVTWCYTGEEFKSREFHGFFNAVRYYNMITKEKSWQ